LVVSQDPQCCPDNPESTPPRGATLPRMALNDLIAYLALRAAAKGISLYDLADKYKWNPAELLAFLRGESAPAEEMLNEMARELDLSPDVMEALLKRD